MTDSYHTASAAAEVSDTSTTADWLVDRQGGNGAAQVSPAETTSSGDLDPGEPFRRVFGWIALVSAGLWGTFMGAFLGYHSFLGTDPWMVRLVEKQFAAMVLVPMAGLGSLCLVLMLRLSSGPIEFKGIGFEFRGASGQLVLWVVCFIALVAAIKLLWI